MQDLTLFMHISLDGYIADRSGYFGMFDVEPEMLRFSREFWGNMDGIVFGRTQYASFEGSWGSMDLDDESRDIGLTALARTYQVMQPYVISRSSDPVNGRGRLLAGDVSAQLGKIKRQSGRGLMIVAGPELAASCLKEQLIDRVNLNVYPIVLGDGTPLFTDHSALLRFRPISARVFASGVVSQLLAVNYGTSVANP